MERIEGRAGGRGRDRGIALVLVLLILATTTIIGIGAVTASISDLKITGNENCYNKLLNTADVGVQDARLYLQNLTSQQRKSRFNTTNNVYVTNPLSFWNIKNCGLNTPQQATDATALCTNFTTPDLTVQAASLTGGLFQVFYEIRWLHRESKNKAIAGENLGTTQSHEFLTHSYAKGCGTTSNLESRIQYSERMIGGSENDYQAISYDPKAGT